MGVACGAKKFLYFTSKTCFPRSFWFWDARRGKKSKHFEQKLFKINNIMNYCTKGGGGDVKMRPTCSKMTLKCTGTFSTPPTLNTGVIYIYIVAKS